MITLLLQDAVALLLAGFSALALIIGRSSAGSASHRNAWMLTGTVLGIYALNNLFQVGFATAAYVAGQEAPVHLAYLRYAPIGNHSRTLLVFVLYGALVWSAVRPAAARQRTMVITATVTVMLLGAFLGWSEGPLDIARHFPTTAVLDTLGFIALSCVLLLVMVRDSVDRFLWFALATYGFTSIIGVLYLSTMAWFYAPGSWTPPPWQIQLWRFLLAAAMVALAVRRLQMARRGVPVTGMIPERTTRISLA